MENNHFDFPPGVAVEAIYKYGKNINRGLLVVGLVLSAIDVGTAVQQDVAEGSGWSHTTRALVTEGFSWAGAIGAAELGFEIGCFGGSIGCIVRAFAGGVIGGYGGEWFANQIYDSPGSKWSYCDIGNHRGQQIIPIGNSKDHYSAELVFYSGTPDNSGYKIPWATNDKSIIWAGLYFHGGGFGTLARSFIPKVAFALLPSRGILYIEAEAASEGEHFEAVEAVKGNPNDYGNAWSRCSEV